VPSAANFILVRIQKGQVVQPNAKTGVFVRPWRLPTPDWIESPWATDREDRCWRLCKKSSHDAHDLRLRAESLEPIAAYHSSSKIRSALR